MPENITAARRSAFDWESLQAQRAERGQAEESLDSLSAELDAVQIEWQEGAESISAQRHDAIEYFHTLIEGHLQSLGMQDARLQVLLTPAEGMNPTGLESVEFLISTNKGQPFGPSRSLQARLSRISLAIKLPALAMRPLEPLYLMKSTLASVAALQNGWSAFGHTGPTSPNPLCDPSWPSGCSSRSSSQGNKIGRPCFDIYHDAWRRHEGGRNCANDRRRDYDQRESSTCRGTVKRAF